MPETFNPAVKTTRRINDKHINHIRNRGINDNWVIANCYSASITESSELLHSKAKSPCIVLKGANGQLQLRPDRPWKNEGDKKAPKYRTAHGDNYDAWLPNHPNVHNYWTDIKALKERCYQINGIPCLLVTEGGFKAIVPTMYGLPTIALLGVEMGLTSKEADPQNKRYLVDQLEHYAKHDFGFIIGFDTDISTKDGVKWALRKLGSQLAKFDVPVYVLPQWDEKLGKGIDDFIMNQGIEEFRQKLISQAITFKNWESEKFTEDDKKETKAQKIWKILEKKFGDRLKFNELKMRLELDDGVADLENLYVDIALNEGFEAEKGLSYDVAVLYGKNNSFHPVRDYLSRVSEAVEPIDIKNLASRYFKTTNPIYDQLFYRHLIGSVARVFEPGCKKDEALILKGNQGIGKSSFLRELYGDLFFTDSLKGVERDDLLVLHQYWCIELAELDYLTSRKESGELKAFLSTKEDTFREPYARASLPRPRSSVITGSCNEETFLFDKTGSRRFWVIPCEYKLDIELIKRERDRIWAAAVAAYKSGEKWWLTFEDEETLRTLNTNFEHEDTWLTPISNYLLSRSEVTTFEVLTQALEFEKNRIKKTDEMRVAYILKQLNFKRTTRSINGKRTRCYVRTPESTALEVERKLNEAKSNDTTDFKLGTPPLEVVSEVVSDETLAVSESEPPTPPTPPTFEKINQDYHHQQAHDNFVPKNLASSVVQVVSPSETIASSEPQSVPPQSNKVGSGNEVVSSKSEQPTTVKNNESLKENPTSGSEKHITKNSITPSESEEYTQEQQVSYCKNTPVNENEERKPDVGDRIELTCIYAGYNRLGTVTSVKELETFVYVRAEFDDLDIHSQYGANDLRFGKDGNAYFA